MPTFMRSFLPSMRLPLPSARLEQILLLDLANVEPLHGLAQFLGGFENGLGILIMRRGLYDGLGALFRIAGFENSRPDENRFGAQMAHQRGIGRAGGFRPRTNWGGERKRQPP